MSWSTNFMNSFLSAPLSNDYIVCVDAVPYLNIDTTMALLPD